MFYDTCQETAAIIRLLCDSYSLELKTLSEASVMYLFWKCRLGSVHLQDMEIRHSPHRHLSSSPYLYLCTLWEQEQSTISSPMVCTPPRTLVNTWHFCSNTLSSCTCKFSPDQQSGPLRSMDKRMVAMNQLDGKCPRTGCYCTSAPDFF